MQRKKMFLVVCLSALLAGGASGQNILPEKAKMVPARQVWGRESFLFRVLPAWEASVRGKTEWGLVLPGKGPGMEGAGRPRGGVGLREEQAGWVVRGGMGLTISERANGYGGLIPADRVVTHFGFFCKRELELEKTIRLPLRFRLGSLEYCNRLEGK